MATSPTGEVTHSTIAFRPLGSRGCPGLHGGHAIPTELDRCATIRGEVAPGKIYEDENLLANHAKRITVYPKDLKLVGSIRGEIE